MITQSRSHGLDLVLNLDAFLSSPCLTLRISDSLAEITCDLSLACSHPSFIEAGLILTFYLLTSVIKSRRNRVMECLPKTRWSQISSLLRLVKWFEGGIEYCQPPYELTSH